jgi:hypothetical protein
MAIDVICEPETKLSGNNSTSVPMVTLVRLVRLLMLKSPFEGQFLAFQVNDVNPEHPANAFSPMDVTYLGMVNDVRPVHSQNANDPIDVTELGIVTLDKLLHP